MLHILLSEPHDVLFDEQKVSLVSLDGVPQIILFDRLLRVSQVRGENSNARCRLQILTVIDFVKELLDRSDHNFRSQIEHFQDPGEHLLEALHVPVLVDDSVNNGVVKHLVGLLGQ